MTKVSAVFLVLLVLVILMPWIGWIPELFPIGAYFDWCMRKQDEWLKGWKGDERKRRKTQ